MYRKNHGIDGVSATCTFSHPAGVLAISPTGRGVCCTWMPCDDLRVWKAEPLHHGFDICFCFVLFFSAINWSDWENKIFALLCIYVLVIQDICFMCRYCEKGLGTDFVARHVKPLLGTAASHREMRTSLSSSCSLMPRRGHRWELSYLIKYLLCKVPEELLSSGFNLAPFWLGRCLSREPGDGRFFLFNCQLSIFLYHSAFQINNLRKRAQGAERESEIGWGLNPVLDAGIFRSWAAPQN